MAFKIVRDWPAAEDIVQDFFIKCWQNRSTLRIEESFIAYAARSIRNRSLNYLEKEEVRQRHEGGDRLLHEDPQAAAALHQQKEEQNVRLIGVIEGLPEQRRKVFMLIHFHHLTYSEAAERLELSVNTVKTHMKLAYAALRHSMLVLLCCVFLGA